MDQTTTDVVTEYIEGTKGDDEIEVAKTTSATMTTKTMATTMATMILTKTYDHFDSACLRIAAYRFEAKY